MGSVNWTFFMKWTMSVLIQKEVGFYRRFI